MGIDSWEEQNYFPQYRWTTSSDTAPKTTNIKTGTNDNFYAKVTDEKKLSFANDTSEMVSV